MIYFSCRPNLTSTVEQNSGEFLRNILATLFNVMEMDKGWTNEWILINKSTNPNVSLFIIIRFHFWVFFWVFIFGIPTGKRELYKNRCILIEWQCAWTMKSLCKMLIWNVMKPIYCMKKYHPNFLLLVTF